MNLRAKHQRLILIGLALAALLGAAMLAMWGLKDRAAYYVTASDIAAGRGASGKAMRLGGMVRQGSLNKASPDGLTIMFVVTDFKHDVRVIYRGIPPDLFREGSGVVAEGKMIPQGMFFADTILAKHDERYMPPQMAQPAK